MIGKSWIIAALIGALAGSIAAAWRGQIGGVDDRQRDICVDVLPVVEPEGTDLIVVLARPAEGAVPGVTLLYDRKRPPGRRDPATIAPDAPTRVALTCRFAGTGIDPNSTRLIGVETARRNLNETQLYFLNRFWLTDRVAVAAARARIGLEEQAPASGLLQLPGPAGYFLQQLVNAGPPAALYGLIAVAYALVYGLTGRINLAFAEITTLGAFAALTGLGLAAVAGGAGVGLALGVAVILAASATAAIGTVGGATLFQPLLRGSQTLLVAGIGLAVAIQEFLARAHGTSERWLSPMQSNSVTLAAGPFDVIVTTLQIIVVVGAALALAATLVMMRRSRFGRAWQAMADDAGRAALIGVDRRKVLLSTLALASALAGLGGAVLTLHYGGTSFHMGTIVGLKALVAAVVGGIGSLGGALVGGVLIGVIETLWTAYNDAQWRDGVVLSLLVVMLVLRPDGLFGKGLDLKKDDQRGG